MRLEEISAGNLLMRTGSCIEPTMPRVANDSNAQGEQLANNRQISMVHKASSANGDDVAQLLVAL